MDEDHINWDECPDVGFLREFIDIDSWNNHYPESLERKPGFAQIKRAFVNEYDDDELDDEDLYKVTEHTIELSVPKDSFQTFFDTLEQAGWEVYTDDAELVDGWYDNVTIEHSIATLLKEEVA